MILSAQSIRARSIFTPFCERTKAHGMTFGLGPAGYDVRVAERLSLPPHSAVLASTMEHFDMPADVLGKVADKSTWARQFLAVQNTIIEPDVVGEVTVSMTANIIINGRDERVRVAVTLDPNEDDDEDSDGE